MRTAAVREKPMRRGLLILCLVASAVAARGGEEISPENRIAVVLTPKRRCSLSTEITTTVSKIRVENGDEFKAGAVLVELDSAVYLANLSRAKANLAAAKGYLEVLDKTIHLANRDKALARLKATAEDLKSKQRLFQDKAISQNELAEAESAAKIAQADLVIADKRLSDFTYEVVKAQAEADRAQAEVDIAARQFDACVIRAPYAGKAAKLLARENERVQAGQDLIEIIDDASLHARFYLPSNLLKLITVGQRVPIHLQELDATVDAVVTNIGAEIEATTSMIEIWAEVPNRETGGKKILYSGMRGVLDMACLNSHVAGQRDGRK